MIIYGTRASHLVSEKLNHEKCPQCGAEDSIVMNLFSRYVHIFWIPVFPFGKKAVSQCQNCQQVLEVKQMPQGFKTGLETIKAKTRTPIWHFTGLVLIAVLVTWSFIESDRDKKGELAFLQAPQVNDVYEFKTNNSHYSTFKIIDIVDDSLIIHQNQYETDKKSGLSKINKAENYLEEPYIISKNELKAMYEEGKIVDISR